MTVTMICESEFQWTLHQKWVRVSLLSLIIYTVGHKKEPLIFLCFPFSKQLLSINIICAVSNSLSVTPKHRNILRK